MIVEITRRPVIVAASFVLGFPVRLDRLHRHNESARRPKSRMSPWAIQADFLPPEPRREGSRFGIRFPHGSLNDVHFIRMSMCLRSPPKTWAYIAGHWLRLWDAGSGWLIATLTAESHFPPLTSVAKNRYKEHKSRSRMSGAKSWLWSKGRINRWRTQQRRKRPPRRRRLRRRSRASSL